jgi:hypothetical protein
MIIGGGKIMLILGALVLFALVGGVMASARNRKAILWMAICFITGFFGIIALAVIGRAGRSGSSSLNKHPGFNMEKWNTLKEVDAEIAEAAAEAHKVAPYVEIRLAQKYLALNDKSYLPQLLKSVVEKSASEPVSGKIKGIAFKTDERGLLVITVGIHKGKSFSSYGALEKFIGAHI